MVAVGVLHSLTGPMGLSELPLRDAALMAIAEINQAGGVLGEQIQPIVADGASLATTFANQAQKLLEEESVVTIFGCWTSASRKAILPVLEEFNALLWYPVQYEGLEQSSHVFYTGSCLNQQVEPAVKWLIDQQKTQFYLLGSDYIFPWAANKLIKAQLKQLGGIIVGESYVALDAQDFTDTITQIQRIQPDVVFNTLNGTSNLSFYQQYKDAGISSDDIPIMAVSIAEVEVQITGEAAVGHYASWSYFQSLDLPENHRFVQNFQHRYGEHQVTSDPISAAYFQVFLWKQAVEKARSFESDRVRKAAYGQTLTSPGGSIKLESNHHIWKPCRIGQVLSGGQFKVVFETPSAIKPLPWLGVEEVDFANADVVIQLLAEVSQWIQKAQQLEIAMAQLRTEMEERQRAEAALRESQIQLSQMQAELAVTRRLQKMLLPKDHELHQIQNLDIAGFMEPAEEVGGDYYDVLQYNGRVKIGIGDVTGHGLESGMVMLMVQTAVRTLLAIDERDPKRFLNVLNRIVYDNVQRMQSHKNMTLMLLDYHEGLLSLSGQHEEMIVVRVNGDIEQFDTLDLGFPIGLEPDIATFIHQAHVQLKKDDVVILYSDGVTEAENFLRKHYGLERLCRVAQQHREQPAAKIREAIIADLQNYIGDHKVYDDITLLVLKQR